MSDDYPVNTPNSHTPQVNKRVEKLNDTLDEHIQELLSQLDATGSDFDALLEIMKDRVLTSTEPAFVIALARLGELRMDVYKKKIDVMKTVVSDKSIEVASKKKSGFGDLDAILSGAAMGAALGVKVGSSAIQPMPEPKIINTSETIPFDIEPVNFNNSVDLEVIDDLLDETKDK